MNAPDSRDLPLEARSRRSVLLSAALITAAAWTSYGNSLHGPFLYDDVGAIERNLTIRHLWSAFRPPPGGLPVSGRPVANLSFALNYAISGLGVWSYHALNLLIHVLAGLTLFGITRRTFLRWHASPPVRAPGGGIQDRLRDGTFRLQSVLFAFVVALFWTLHPLQTEAVTYLSQRTESLMGLFYLLTLYCFVRHVEWPKGRAGPLGPPVWGGHLKFGGPSGAALARRPWFLDNGWAGLTILCCLLGMATKEVMATAPVMVFLYDGVFVSGGFREAWRRHRSLHLGLAATWILLAFLVISDAGRGRTAGFSSSVPWWAYAFTQFRAVAHYLRLCLWPHPLSFDYGLILGGPAVEMAWDIFLVAGLAAISTVLLFRGSPLGFLGAWFFLILAPSSSLVPVSTEIIAEHRAYLSLAAVIAAAAWGACAAWRSLDPRPAQNPLGFATVGVILILAGALGSATCRRNEVYLSFLALWSDAVVKMPASAGARNNLGNALAERGSLTEAIVQYRQALRLAPDYDDANYNLGNALSKVGRPAEAVGHYHAALRFRPNDTAIHYALGNALKALGRPQEARREYLQASAGTSDLPEVWYNLGNALLDDGRLEVAAAAYAEAVRLRPDYADALANYAGILAQLGRATEAIVQFQAALRLEPQAADLHNNLGGLLAENGRTAEAAEEFEYALRIKPDYREARDNLERVRAMERSAGRP